MSLLKDIVGKGIYYNSIGIKNYMPWSKMMLDHFGSEIKQSIKDIRMWSLVISASADNRSVLKLNCWEFMGCGLQNEASVLNTNARDICPAYLEKKLDGIHGGNNAGRACWVVSNTMCSSSVQENYEKKFKACVMCDFYRCVKEEEDNKFIISHILKGML